MRWPETQGEELPAESGVFHNTLVVGPKWMGGMPPPMPRPFGPRNCGHCDSAPAPLAATQQSNDANVFQARIRCSSRVPFGNDAYQANGGAAGQGRTCARR